MAWALALVIAAPAGGVDDFAGPGSLSAVWMEPVSGDLNHEAGSLGCWDCLDEDRRSTNFANPGQ